MGEGDPLGEPEERAAAAGTHERPYKGAWPVEKAVDEILGQAGRQFDAAVVEAFSRLDYPTLLSRVTEWGRATKGRPPRPGAQLVAHA